MDLGTVKAGLNDAKYKNIDSVVSDMELVFKNAMAFNCVQRGHQNLLENWNRFLILLTIASINYPRLAALGGLLRVIAMVVYCNEYGKGKPENRRKAAFGYIGTLLNLGLSIMTVGGLIMQSM